MRLFRAQVVGNEEILPDTHIISIQAGVDARTASPGRFIHIRCGDGTLLRRPMSIYRVEGAVIELMIQDAGRGSGWLTRRRLGDELDCLGPLGRGFQLDQHARNLLMVGTGFGVATLAGFAEQAIARGVNVTLAVGAETATHVLPPHLLPDAVEYVVATADGTAGHAGSVVELLGGRIAWADGVCAYASRTATRQLADVLRREAPRKPAQVAIVERMGCAMGVCLGCVVETTKGPLRTCTEGPVFDIHQLMLRDDPDVSDRTLMRIGE